jgi:hypothetical protein
VSVARNFCTTVGKNLRVFYILRKDTENFEYSLILKLQLQVGSRILMGGTVKVYQEKRMLFQIQKS